MTSLADAPPTVEARAHHKAVRRLIPFICLLYFVSFLDRVNIGFAALTMNVDLGLSPAVYGEGAGIFFLGYFLFGIPSNILLHKYGARRWIARIMILWGLVSIGMVAVVGPLSYFAVRLLLGAAEAGFFPGIILYLTYWFPSAVRGRILGGFLLALPLSAALGAPFSTWILDQHVAGLAGWQTMFVIEGLPAVILGLAVWRLLPDRPRDARWLTAEESAALEAAVARDVASGPREERLWGALRSPRVWHLALVYLGAATGLYGFGFWAPQIIKSLGDLTNRQVGLLTMIPYSLAGFALWFWARSTDRSGERHWHVVGPVAVAMLGFAAAALLADPAARLAALSIAAIGVYAALPVFWTRPTALLAGPAAAAGIGLINAIGNIGGYIGPVAIGSLQKTYGYAGGLGLLAVVSFAMMVLALLLPADRMKKPG
jgi:ACS family tartrate transporter-like MFS transporter